MNLWLKSCLWRLFYCDLIRKLAMGKYWLGFLTIYLFVPGQLEQGTLKTAWEMPLKSELHFLNHIIKKWPVYSHSSSEKVMSALSLSVWDD